MEIFSFEYKFEYEMAKIEFSYMSLKFETGPKLILLINEVNEIEQNLTENFVHYCSLMKHSVNKIRILYKTVNFCYFLQNIV